MSVVNFYVSVNCLFGKAAVYPLVGFALFKGIFRGIGKSIVMIFTISVICSATHIIVESLKKRHWYSSPIFLPDAYSADLNENWAVLGYGQLNWEGCLTPYP